jgi:chemotaxis protein histidine kinase CheA
VDPALLDLFRAEMDAHVPVLSQGLLALEKGRAGDKDLEGMMRAAHSIKGAARIVGIEAAVRVAHVIEDCFSAAQGHRIALSSEAVDVLLQGVDALQRICSPQADSAMTEPSIQALLDRITAVRDGRPSPPPLAEAQEAPVPPVAVELTLFHQPDRQRYLLCMVNFQSELPNIPVDNVEVRLHLPHRVRSIRQLAVGRAVRHRQRNGVVSFIAPRLESLSLLAVNHA